MKDFKISIPERINGYRIPTVVIGGLKFYCVDFYESKMYFRNTLFLKYLEDNHIKVINGNYEDIDDMEKYYEAEDTCLLFNLSLGAYIPRRVLEDYIDWSIEYMTYHLYFE